MSDLKYSYLIIIGSRYNCTKYTKKNKQNYYERFEHKSFITFSLLAFAHRRPCFPYQAPLIQSLARTYEKKRTRR